MAESTTTARSRAAQDILDALIERRDSARVMKVAADMTVAELSDETVFPEAKVREALLELEGEGLVTETLGDHWIFGGPGEDTADDGPAGDDLDELEGEGDPRDGAAGDWPEEQIGDFSAADAYDEHATDGADLADERAGALPDDDMQLPARQVDEAELVEGDAGADAVEALTDDDVLALQALEQQVAEGIRGFFAAGLALIEISERKLYRATHKTFEAYLQERWDIGDSQGYRIIEAAKVQQDLAAVGVTLARESHCRPLGNLTTAQRQEVGRRLDGCERVTANVVEAAVERMFEDAVVAAIEGASEPMSEEMLRGVAGPNAWHTFDSLVKAGRIHPTSNSWPRMYALGPVEYFDTKVTVAAELVRRIATEDPVGRDPQEFVRFAVVKALNAMRAKAKDGGDDGDS